MDVCSANVRYRPYQGQGMTFALQAWELRRARAVVSRQYVSLQICSVRHSNVVQANVQALL